MGVGFAFHATACTSSLLTHKLRIAAFTSWPRAVSDTIAPQRQPIDPFATCDHGHARRYPVMPRPLEIPLWSNATIVAADRIR
jgi:hypothetical protein